MNRKCPDQLNGGVDLVSNYATFKKFFTTAFPIINVSAFHSLETYIMSCFMLKLSKEDMSVDTIVIMLLDFLIQGNRAIMGLQNWTGN